MILSLKNCIIMVLLIVTLWCHNISEGEEQFVVIKKDTLTTQEIITGVSQGLDLGTLLFLIYTHY